MFGITPDLSFDNASTVGDMRRLMKQTKEYADTLERRIQSMEIDTAQKVAELQYEIGQAKLQTRPDTKYERFELIDTKVMAPNKFDGSKLDEYRSWAKRTKAYCNAKRIGFRKVLDFCEKTKNPVDQIVMTSWGWAPASAANQFEADKKLYDLLILICSGEALNLVERRPDEGFESWRQLALRFNPVGETYTFDKMNALMHQSRARNMTELPAAIDTWEASVRKFEERSGEMFPEVMRMPVLMQMIPAKDLEQVLYKYRMNPEKDYATFANQLKDFGLEKRYESRRAGGGGNDMDVDNAEPAKEIIPPGEGLDYSDDQWKEYYSYVEDQIAAQQEELNWMGKAGGKSSGGKAKGKGKDKGKSAGGKGGARLCLWCEKAGHEKKDCRAFAKWKDDKDKARAAAGQPPYVPRTRDTPLKNIEASTADYVPLGGMTEECGVIEAEDCAEPMSLSDYIAIPDGQNPLDDAQDWANFVDQEDEYAEFLAPPERRMYEAMQTRVRADEILPEEDLQVVESEIDPWQAAKSDPWQRRARASHQASTAPISTNFESSVSTVPNFESNNSFDALRTPPRGRSPSSKRILSSQSITVLENVTPTATRAPASAATPLYDVFTAAIVNQKDVEVAETPRVEMKDESLRFQGGAWETLPDEADDPSGANTRSSSWNAEVMTPEEVVKYWEKFERDCHDAASASQDRMPSSPLRMAGGPKLVEGQAQTEYRDTLIDTQSQTDGDADAEPDLVFFAECGTQCDLIILASDCVDVKDIMGHENVIAPPVCRRATGVERPSRGADHMDIFPGVIAPSACKPEEERPSRGADLKNNGEGDIAPSGPPRPEDEDLCERPQATHRRMVASSKNELKGDEFLKVEDTDMKSYVVNVDKVFRYKFPVRRPTRLRVVTQMPAAQGADGIQGIFSNIPAARGADRIQNIHDDISAAPGADVRKNPPGKERTGYGEAGGPMREPAAG